MFSFVFYIWILLTSAIAAICSVCLVQPFWIIHPDNIHSFGLQKYCTILTSSDKELNNNVIERICIPFGEQFQLGNIPSGTWRASFLLFSCGTFLFIGSILLGIVSLFVKGKWEENASTTTRYIQTAAVVLLVSALLTYPFGFNSRFFRYYCTQEANIYKTGDCDMGWGYMLAIMGVALSVFCPVLWTFRKIKHPETLNGSAV